MRPVQPERSSRFIPARAGNASRMMSRTGTVPVHPRASGERADVDAETDDSDGSSPRERGTLLFQRRDFHCRRFIPARAGNATAITTRTMSSPVHPRASGERTSRRATHGRQCGSSPRERGTRAPAPSPEAPRRFIPARAGNAGMVVAQRHRDPVHPRASGERTERRSARSSGSGSSPRERGTLALCPHKTPLLRFIPARAGNATVEPGVRCCISVHPRASGERLAVLPGDFDQSGSSPRERGTPVSEAVRARCLRFIPARAGNARGVYVLNAWIPVHPRASGEREELAMAEVLIGGSSPRERGTLFLEELDLVGFLRCQTAHRQFSHFLAVCQRLRLLRERAERTAPA